MTPQDFEACIRKKGSKKVTKLLPGGRYVHGCKDEKGMHWGEVKQRKETKIEQDLKGGTK